MLKKFRTAWVVPALFFLVAGCSNGADAAADNPCAADAMDHAEDAMDDAMDHAEDAVDGAMDDAADAVNPCGG